MKRKLFTFLLAIVTSIGLTHAEKVKIGDLYYNLDATNQTAEVTYEKNYSNNYTNITAADIPASVKYEEQTYSVTSIGGSAFYGCSGLTSVTIPNSVTSIEYFAFYGCSSLTSIDIPNSITSIGTYAFSKCSGLISIDIPNSVTSIESCAFDGCSGLSSLNIPNSVTKIVSSTFSGCSSLTSIGIPNSITSIGDLAFYDCSSLTSIIIPNRVTSIGERAFKGCSGLTSVTLGNSVTSIGIGAFWACSSLTSVVWNIKNIDDFSSDNTPFYYSGLFDIRKQITSFTFGEDVERIPNYLCNGMSNLASVTIGSKVTSIERYAFKGCSSLGMVNISDLAAWCNISFSYYDTNPLYRANHLFLNDEEIIDLVIPDGVTSIGSYAFYGCSSLTSVNIPNSLTSIGQSAFSGCSNLTKVNISDLEAWCKISFSHYVNNPLFYAKHLFLNDKEITNLVIPNRVTSIGHYAFYNCSSLISVSIPESVTSIGSGAFDGCNSLTKVNISDLEAWCKIDFSSNNPLYYAKHLFLNDAEIIDLVIPSGITSIKQYTFNNCSSMTSVTIPNSVISIEKSAFSGCSSLTSVTIPNSVTSIGNGAFEYCSSLTSVVIPESVTSIGESAFSHCSSLTSASIGNGATSIESYTFWDCRNLTSITVGSSVTSIKDNAFESCRGLTKVNISDIAAWCNISFSRSNSNPLYYANHLFLNDVEITDLVIPDGVTSVGYYAFYGCSSLTSVTIPASVKSIGNSAFFNCSSLTKVNISDLAAWCNISFAYDANPLYYAHHLFQNNIEVVNLIIPNGVTNIGNNAFYNCNSLASVTIPESVTSIGSGAFFNCSSLTKVNISDLAAWCSINFSNYSANPLFYAKHLFLNDAEITDLIIPSEINAISNYAFCNCTLNNIYVMPTTPPVIDSNTFKGVSSDAVVYVSIQALDAYQSASYWQDMNLIGIIFSGAETSAAPTSASVTAIQNVWELANEFIVSCGEEGGETFAGNVLEFTGLEPETEYNKTIALTSNTGETETINVSFTTTALQLTTQQPSIVSSSMAILLAETNMADAEVNCGFEWRRDNQPEGMASTKVYAPVANGVMAGRLKGLKDDVYYKYRAFYESTAGNKYYGDWQYIFTGDNTVEFDPVMYTYPAQAVTETTAILRGYALAGSDDFTEQGFEYWVEKRVTPESAAGAPYRAYKSAIGEHMTVQASGISMKVTLTDLDEGSVYKYRSYAVVDGQTVYGSEETFTTRGEYLYTVTFVDYDGTILGTDKVHYGDAATAPEDPIREGYEFTGWDNDFSNVTDDLTITATYSIATALPESTATQSKAQKLLHDGQLFIVLPDGTRYTATGVKVE